MQAQLAYRAALVGSVALPVLMISCPAGAIRDSARGNSGQAGAAQDSVRGNLGQVNNGAASKGHYAAGRAGQSRGRQERLPQPAPDSSDAGSMERPSPAKQEPVTKLEPEVRTQSPALKTLLDMSALLPAGLPNSVGCGCICQAISHCELASVWWRSSH